MWNFKLKTTNRRDTYSHIKNVTNLIEDSDQSEEQFDYLWQLCDKYGVGQKQVQGIISGSKEIEFEEPDTPKVKFQHLFELTQMAVRNGGISPKQKRFCEEIACKYGFSDNQAKELISSISSNILLGNSKDETYKRLSINFKF